MRSRLFALGIGLVMASFGLGSAPVAAEEATSVQLLEQAIAAYDDLRIEDALELLDRAQDVGGLTQEQQARLHLYRGLALVSFGRSADADSAFRQALTLDSSIELPPHTSPVVVEQFETIRQDLPAPPEPEMSRDPEVSHEPAPAIESGVEVTEPPERRLLMTWVFLGLTAATFVGGATSLVLALVTRSLARDEARPQAEVNDMLDTYRLEARMTFGFLSASVAVGIVTLVTYFGERDRPAAANRSNTPAVTLLPTTGGLVLSGVFGR